MRIYPRKQFLASYRDLFGKMRRRSTLIISVFLLFLVVSGCRLVSSGGRRTDTTSPTASGASKTNGAGPISTSDKPVDVITKAIRAQNDAKSYRSHLEVRIGGVLEQTSNSEYVAPDRYQTKGSVTGLQTNGETIIIGKDTWIKHSNGEWKKSPVDLSDAFAAIHSRLNGEMMKDVDVRLVGPDTVDGTPTLVYAYTINATVEDAKIDENIKVWISTADGMIRKTESEKPGDKTNQVQTFADYNSDIKIEPPM